MSPAGCATKRAWPRSAGLIRFDAVGLGLSDPTAAPPSIEAWAADAAAVLDDVGVAQADILASSGGSLPAIWLAAHHPERCARWC